MEQPVKLNRVGLPAGRFERRRAGGANGSPSRETDSGRRVVLSMIISSSGSTPTMCRDEPCTLRDVGSTAP
jgi:hypothetical protein